MTPSVEPLRAPPPTTSELRLRHALAKRGIPFAVGKVIWYTSSRRFTPDLIVGTNMVVEVDGRVHCLPQLKTNYRMRDRALKAMGYFVMHVKNSDVQNSPDGTAESIAQSFYEVS